MSSPLVEDPVMRQRYRFSHEGDVLRLELWADPGARVPEHFHPQIEERFEVREGTFIFKVNGRKHPAGPGERLVVEAGTRHAFENAGPSVGHFVAEVRPALDVQALFEESAALARAGMFMRPGVPKGLRGLLAAAELAERYHDIYRQTFPPQVLQRILLPPVARIARWRRRKTGR
jgi:quercetin dioxygenase-like cupin family protein